MGIKYKKKDKIKDIYIKNKKNKNKLYHNFKIFINLVITNPFAKLQIFKFTD